MEWNLTRLDNLESEMGFVHTPVLTISFRNSELEHEFLLKCHRSTSTLIILQINQYFCKLRISRVMQSFCDSPTKPQVNLQLNLTPLGPT